MISIFCKIDTVIRNINYKIINIKYFLNYYNNNSKKLIDSKKKNKNIKSFKNIVTKLRINLNST